MHHSILIKKFYPNKTKNKTKNLLDQDIVLNDKENNNFFVINFDNNHNVEFDLILKKNKQNNLIF